MIPIGPMMTTNLSFGSAAGIQGANHDRMALANNVTEHTANNPSELMDVYMMDKAAMLKGASDQANFLAAQAMEEPNRKLVGEWSQSFGTFG